MALWRWAMSTDAGARNQRPAARGTRGARRRIIAFFTHGDGGLQARGGPLQGFIIASEDRQWKPAVARIAGDQVIVSSPEVKKPLAIRYAWEDDPPCNLFNAAGLPASPFRTDDWPSPADAAVQQPIVHVIPDRHTAGRAPAAESLPLHIEQLVDRSVLHEEGGMAAVPVSCTVAAGKGDRVEVRVLDRQTQRVARDWTAVATGAKEGTFRTSLVGSRLVSN